jgi:hypothetical protein
VIAFYISGHGFGHASRDIEIINALATRLPDLRILLRTSVPRWLLDRTITCAFDLDDRPCDTGVVQIDSLRLDATATITRARDFYATLESRAVEEAALLRRGGVRLVLSDAPPLACAAAAQAGIPSIVVGNFTWDWIYQEYGGELASAPALIPAIQNAYRHSREAWRLPMHGGFEAFERIVDIPFVARHARHGTNETRARLGLPDDRRVALSSFGGYGVHGLDLRRLDCLDEWDLVITGRERPPALPAQIHFFEEEQIYDAGLRYEDVVRACDVVVTKPGYGIISECIANDTAIVHTSRGRFAEYPVLVREMKKYLRDAYLDQDALFEGRWRDVLNRAVSSPAPPERPRTDGAQVIADMIAALSEVTA